MAASTSSEGASRSALSLRRLTGRDEGAVLARLREGEGEESRERVRRVDKVDEVCERRIGLGEVTVELD